MGAECIDKFRVFIICAILNVGAYKRGIYYGPDSRRSSHTISR